MKKEELKKEYDLIFIYTVLRTLWIECPSYKDIEIRFNVPYQTVSAWNRKYWSEREMILSTDISQTMMKTDNKDQEIEKLKKALHVCSLHISGLETMIDIAEATFKIEIKKKSGTKQ